LDSLAEVIALLDRTKSMSDETRLPDSLRERIRVDARRELSRPTEATRPGLGRLRVRTFLLWAVAVACLLVAVATLVTNWPFGRPGPTPDLARMRDQLIASAPDVVRADWSAGPTPIPGAGGDVAWSAGEQRGYMRFHGMRPNDPTVEQYQLWIFDRHQDEKAPVDGGVFDIASDGEVVVPIRAALRVREPYLFAVTIEKPGGVVVSDRRRLPLTAAMNP